MELKNLLLYIKHLVIGFVNKRPMLKCYFYSIIAAALEGRMAEGVNIDYVYYMSCIVVEAVIKKHPRYFFGAFFRKHVNTPTLRGLICRQLLISYIMLLLVELDQQENQRELKKNHVEGIVILRRLLNKAFNALYEKIINFFNINSKK